MAKHKKNKNKGQIQDKEENVNQAKPPTLEEIYGQQTLQEYLSHQKMITVENNQQFKYCIVDNPNSFTREKFKWHGLPIT